MSLRRKNGLMCRQHQRKYGTPTVRQIGKHCCFSRPWNVPGICVLYQDLVLFFLRAIRKYIFRSLTVRRQLMDCFFHNHHQLLLNTNNFRGLERSEDKSSQPRMNTPEHIIIYKNRSIPLSLQRWVSMKCSILQITFYSILEYKKNNEGKVHSSKKQWLSKKNIRRRYGKE